MPGPPAGRSLEISNLIFRAAGHQAPIEQAVGDRGVFSFDGQHQRRAVGSGVRGTGAVQQQTHDVQRGGDRAVRRLAQQPGTPDLRRRWGRRPGPGSRPAPRPRRRPAPRPRQRRGPCGGSGSKACVPGPFEHRGLRPRARKKSTATRFERARRNSNTLARCRLDHSATLSLWLGRVRKAGSNTVGTIKC